MSDDTVNIEVNGVALVARKGEMIIRATDEAGVYVPRFCYHEKLSIAANCRMCLVEVEKAPKPLPACATPVAEGMKVFTRSPRAIAAQKATMEFLLINHPLDCPICDQGGECELQDLAMGFGRDVSRYTERKRVVKDKDIGPLVSTDMTRCIQCTRCVRFGAEIAGIQELGTIGRGENMEITTYVERSVDHELSGNIIDLCPVGALNSRPFRFQARSWEMTQHPLVSPHDCVGSNLFGHVHRREFLRVVPQPNEQINETWLADRDRFSYQGVYAQDRLRTPLIRQHGEWRSSSWSEALAFAARRLREALADDGSRLGVLGSPSATLEELFLLQQLARELGSGNVDHRLRMRDFRNAAQDPQFPSLGVSIAGLEERDAVLVVGGDLRHEAPILAHRLRKAALGGSRVSFVNPPGLEHLFPVAHSLEAAAAELTAALAGIVASAAGIVGRDVPGAVRELAARAPQQARSAQIARSLLDGERSSILLGALASRHPAYVDLRVLADALAGLTNASVGTVSEGANAAGAWLAGAVPHRGPGGEPASVTGLDLRGMLTQPRAAYLLLNLEPERDCLDAELALAAMTRAELVIALTAYDTPAMREYAEVLLPIGTFAETDGTFVNCEGRWQSWEAIIPPLGESRPGWKVLRVLASQLELPLAQFASTQAIRDSLRERIGEPPASQDELAAHEFLPADAAIEVPRVAMYDVDPVVRRADALQATRVANAGERTRAAS